MACRRHLHLAILLGVLFLVMSTAEAQPSSPEWQPEESESLLSELGCFACRCAGQFCYHHISSPATSSAQNYASDSCLIPPSEPWMPPNDAASQPDQMDYQPNNEFGQSALAMHNESSLGVEKHRRTPSIVVTQEQHGTQEWVDSTHNVGDRSECFTWEFLQGLQVQTPESPFEPPEEPQFHQEGNLTRCRNFIDDLPQEVFLEGREEDTEDLMFAISPNLRRQNTPYQNLMCGLYALEISFGAMAGATAPSFDQLLAIRSGHSFEERAAARLQLIEDGDGQRQLCADLNAGSNFSLEVLWLIVQIWAEETTQSFNLGVCAFKGRTNDMTGNIYNVYRLSLESAPAHTRTVWIVNDNAEETNEGTWSHWSGIGPDSSPPLPGSPDSASIDPRILQSPMPSPEVRKRPSLDIPSPSRTRSPASSPTKRPRPRSTTPSTAGSSHSHSCDECSGTFADAGGLRRHKRIHNPSKRNHTCPQCKRSFLFPKDLKRHAPVHAQGREVLPCLDPACPETFTRDDNRRRHVARAHPEHFVTG